MPSPQLKFQIQATSEMEKECVCVCREGGLKTVPDGPCLAGEVSLPEAGR